MLNPQVILEDAAVGACVTYHRGFLDRDTANALFNWMRTNTPWQREAPVVFGKAHEVKRRTYAYGEAGLTYRYSGVDRVAVAWPELLMPVVERLRNEIGAPFNYGLCNFYPDGEAKIGRHPDAEAEIVRDSPIVGLSLGATRDFVLYRRKGKHVAEVALEHGSTVVMWGSTQRYFEHAVPPRRRVKEPRVNVTFRVMKEDRR